MDLTKVQITKKRWNVKNREYKKQWDRKNRPWKYKDLNKLFKKQNPEQYKIFLEKRKKWDKKYKAKPEVKEKQKIYAKTYRERRKLDPNWITSLSRYNPIRAKINREKHKKNKTNKWFGDNLRKIIYDVFRRRSSINYKELKSQQLLGANFQIVKTHIESLFQPGMSWDNYGKWHIDHKVPCSAFDLKCPVQQLACCHYTNLQPLWARENYRKGAKIISGDITSPKM